MPEAFLDFPPRENGRATLRSKLLRLGMGLGFFVLVAQLWRLQVVEGKAYLQQADMNRLRVSQIAPPRGLVYDRNGQILAENAPIFIVSIVPADLPKGGEAEVYSRLGKLLGMDPQKIAAEVQDRLKKADKFTPVPLKYNADRRAVLEVEEHHFELPGVLVNVESTRKYPQAPLLSHILGYASLISPELLGKAKYETAIRTKQYTINDKVGATGLEYQYEKYLRGTPGQKLYEVDVSGRPVREIREQAPLPGDNLVLTIDLDLQRAVARILREGLRDPTSSGTVVVMNPNNGHVLAMVNWPEYDNNVFSGEPSDSQVQALLKDPRLPLFNRAISGQYSAGSVFKLVTAAGALQEGLVHRDTIIESKGAIYVPNEYNPAIVQRLPDWAALGKMNFIQGLAYSSDVYFYYLGGGYKDFQGLGNERLAAYAKLFGYGAPTGIDLPGEVSGVVPDAAWKMAVIHEPWVKGDTYNMAIGQGYVETTPLQIANVTNAIANGGILYKPELVKEVTDTGGKVLQVTQPNVIRRVPVDPRHLALIREGMAAGFKISPLLKDHGIPGIDLAGKTGTAEYYGPRTPDGQLPTHGWFTGFGPVEQPQISVTVFVEKGMGTRDAVPIAQKVFEYYFKAGDSGASHR